MNLKPVHEYRIFNKQSNIPVIVQKNNLSKDASIIQGKSKITDKWLIQPVHDQKYYRIINVKSNLVLSIKDDSDDDNARIIQSEWSNKEHQQWKIRKDSRGNYTFKNKANGKFLCTKDGNTAAGTELVIHKNTDIKRYRKKWKIKPIKEHFASGDWIIGVTDDRYLTQDSDQNKPSTTTKPDDSSRIQLILKSKAHDGLRYGYLKYTENNKLLHFKADDILLTDNSTASLTPWTIIDEGDYGFSVRKDAMNYLIYDEDTEGLKFGTYSSKTIFQLKLRIFDKGTNPDALQPGEVALFTEENYDGHAYVIHGNYHDLGIFKDLGIDNTTKSILVGADSFTRFYRKKDYEDTYDEASESLTTLKDSPVGRDTISSIKTYVASEMPYQGHWAVQLWSSAQFNIINKNSMKMLHVSGGSSDDGVNVHQDEWSDGSSKVWTLENVGDNWYKIISKVSGKVLEVADKSKDNNANVQQNTWKGKSNQQWKLQPQTGGYYTLINKHSGMALSIENASLDKNANVNQQTCTYSDEQLWMLSPERWYWEGNQSGHVMNTRSSLNDHAEIRFIEHQPYADGVQEVSIYYPHLEHYLGIVDGKLQWGDQKASSYFLLHEEENRLFSLQDADSEQWVVYHSDDDTFRLDDESAHREIFNLAVKIAVSHKDTGTLENGEVAFYEYENFKGKNWVFYQNYSQISEISDIKVKSMRLGIHTDVTVFYHHHYHGSTKTFTQDMDSMDDNSFKFDKIGSLITGSIELAEEAGVKILNTLSQDYKDDGKASSYNNYRTSIQFPANVTTVQIHATAKATIHFGSNEHDIDPIKSKIVTLEDTKHLTINMTAENISVPALLIRTDTMPANEYFPVYPDQDGHSRISNMEEDQLWNYKHDDKHIIDKDKYSKKQVADVQKSITQLASAIKYVPGKSSVGKHHHQTVSTETNGDKHWQLLFGDEVEYKTISTFDEARGINSQAEEFEFYADDDIDLAQWFGSTAWHKIKDSADSLTHIVVHTADKAVDKIKDIASDVQDTLVATFHYIEDGVTKAFQFVVQAAKYVGAMIETILDKIEVALEDFIKMLRFLFEWDDILHTQKILENAFDKALDYADKGIDSLQKTVDGYLKSFEDTIEEVLDNAIESVTGTKMGTLSNDEQDSYEEGVEKVYWFFSMVTNGMNHSPMDLGYALDNKPSIDTSSLLGKLEKVIIDTFDDDKVETALLQVYNTLKDKFTSMPSAQDVLVLVLETFKALIELFLSGLRGVFDLFIAILHDVIDYIKGILDYKWEIPVLSDLYRKETGDDLTVKSLVSLFIAIPSTVAAKALHDVAPFKDVSSVPDLPQIKAQSLARLVLLAIAADWALICGKSGTELTSL
ncbi:MAG: RICIN domain-containing protein, partial [Bacteroidota bacterium]